MNKNSEFFQFYFRQQQLTQDHRGYNIWKSEVRIQPCPAYKSAILLCDVWDKHPFRGAVERLEAIIPRMNTTIAAAREKGTAIIHAPSDTMDYYANSPARQRILTLPVIDPPADIEHEDPPLPFDARENGSDTGEIEGTRNWTRQNPGIEIDEDLDLISDRGEEVYSFLKHREIEWLLIMGVHTTMCILHRSFAIKQMVRWGVNVALIRDLTDSIYNPALPPYISHEEGTQLAIGFIEKFWCPSLQSTDLTRQDLQVPG